MAAEGRHRDGRTGAGSVRPAAHVVGCLVAAVAAVALLAHEPVAAGAGNESLGAELYGRDCAGCHGADGEGSSRGTSLERSGEAAAHYMLVTGRMPISAPDEDVRRKPSPYSEEEVEALIDHVARLGDGPELPHVRWRSADLGLGGELYRLHCGACHSATAIGGALAFDRFAPSLMPSEPSVVAAAVTSGPGAMPSFDPQGFTDDELASIVAYVQELQQPTDRGGWPILRAGRSDETAFAWVVAIPVLALFAGWIARRVR